MAPGHIRSYAADIKMEEQINAKVMRARFGRNHISQPPDAVGLAGCSIALASSLMPIGETRGEERCGAGCGCGLMQPAADSG